MSSIFKLIEADVNLCLSRYGDSTPFFDNLDYRLTVRPYFRYLQDRILLSDRPDAILGSGKFGWAFSMFLHGYSIPVLNFPGDLRHQPLVDPAVDPHFEGKKFVFVDNSIYKGRTLSQIKEYVTEWGGEVTDAFILYDGTHPPHSELNLVPNFHSVYRWHYGGYRIWQPRRP